MIKQRLKWDDLMDEIVAQSPHARPQLPKKETLVAILENYH